MELHQLRYFLAVADAGSFSRAARNCHVAQPSLSQQILKLESELGERLFDRKSRQTTLTAAGEVLRARATAILHQVAEAQREVNDSHGETRGQVNLGALPTIAPYLLPKILRGFARKYPRVETIVHEETTDRVVRQLEAQEIDLALVSLPVPSRQVAIHALFREELLLALPRRHHLVRKARITVADLEPQQFIFMADAHCLGTQTLQFCYAKGFTPRISCRSAQMETVQALVAAGVGISLVPALARETGAAVSYRSLGRPRPARTVALIWNKSRHLSRAAIALRDYIMRQPRKIAGSRSRPAPG